MKKIPLLLLLALAVAGCSHPAYYAAPPPAPPPAYSEVARGAFHDGVLAAQRDIRQGKAPDVNRHPEFRTPPVGPPFIEDYRQGFRSGYEQTFRHERARGQTRDGAGFV